VNQQTADFPSDCFSAKTYGWHTFALRLRKTQRHPPSKPKRAATDELQGRSGPKRLRRTPLVYKKCRDGSSPSTSAIISSSGSQGKEYRARRPLRMRINELRYHRPNGITNRRSAPPCWRTAILTLTRLPLQRAEAGESQDHHCRIDRRRNGKQ
jgi:hypothetical protein